VQRYELALPVLLPDTRQCDAVMDGRGWCFPARRYPIGLSRPAPHRLEAHVQRTTTLLFFRLEPAASQMHVSDSSAVALYKSQKTSLGGHRGSWLDASKFTQEAWANKGCFQRLAPCQPSPISLHSHITARRALYTLLTIDDSAKAPIPTCSPYPSGSG